MPCLNEADTLAICIEKARNALETSGIDGEIVVADNGSTDGSQAIARKAGARVVDVQARGYGNALMGGIAAARGRFVMMGDADDSYDWGEIPRFVEELRKGFDLVQGCRLPSGGGRILPGAMPVSHRWVGNPLFTKMVRVMFGARVNDVYCGMRGFSRELYERLDLRCTGMEFATEMIIKASLYRERIAEVPITLHPDGRKAHPPHLSTVRDGWRTLRFFLMYSPRWLFFYPGAGLALLGLAAYAMAMPAVEVRGVVFDVHTLLVGSLALLMGWQTVLFGLFTRVFAVSEGLVPADPQLEKAQRVLTLERGIAFGSLAFIAGMALILFAFDIWRRAGFGPLHYATTMRIVIPGTTLGALGFQTVLSSFFLSILGMRRR
jgi:glycosyltransferase involved in cell wall biosynthesis